jgi:hypothetical protein
MSCYSRTVPWVDFQLSECAECEALQEGDIEEEWELVQSLVGPGGEMFKSR